MKANCYLWILSGYLSVFDILWSIRLGYFLFWKTTWDTVKAHENEPTIFHVSLAWFLSGLVKNKHAVEG